MGHSLIIYLTKFYFRSLDEERVDALHVVFPKYADEISELVLRKPDILNVNIKSIKDYSRQVHTQFLESFICIDLLGIRFFNS